MEKYRKRQLVVDAEQFFPDRLPWPNGVIIATCALGFTPRYTFRGLTLWPGDWIVPCENGYGYAVVSPAAFSAQYDRVKDAEIIAAAVQAECAKHEYCLGCPLDVRGSGRERPCQCWTEWGYCGPKHAKPPVSGWSAPQDPERCAQLLGLSPKPL